MTKEELADEIKSYCLANADPVNIWAGFYEKPGKSRIRKRNYFCLSGRILLPDLFFSMRVKR